MPKAPPLTRESARILDAGLTKHKSGDLEGALAAYDTVLSGSPEQPEALSLKATILMQRGDSRSACTLFERASQLRPEDALIWNDFGMALEVVGDTSRAKACFHKAVAIAPNLASAQVNVARSEYQSGNLAQALIAAESATKSEPSFAAGHNIYSIVLRTLGQLENALSASEAAVAIDAENPESFLNKGLAELDLEKYQFASESFEKASHLSEVGGKVWLDALVGLGVIQATQDNLDGAIEIYERVLSALPSHLEASFNCAEINSRLGHIADAERGYRHCLTINPDYSPAKYNLGLLHLLHRRWSDGWPAYELRWKESITSSKIRDHGLTRWNGKKSPQRRLLVWGEQGLGDQILFAGMLPDAISCQRDIALEIDPRLAPLVARALPDLPVYGYDAVPDNFIAGRDAQIPLGSLGLYLRPTSESFPSPSAYLAADSLRQRTFEEIYDSQAAGRIKIGIAWRSVHPTLGDTKSLPLDQWHPIIDAVDALFVSVQYGDVEQEINDAGFGRKVIIDNALDPKADFDGAAAQIAALDLIICTSGTAAHLAGALGKEAWVMLPKVPEWRWGLEGDRALWYPNVSLFRQQEMGDWSEPLAAVAKRLADRIHT